MHPQRDAADGPLTGLRVIDASTVLAGPLACQILGDFGADVIKVEHPDGDSFRTHGATRDGHGLWWKMVGRNKRCIGLYLGDPAGAAIFRDLAATADVVVENFRPGTMERWGLGYDDLAGTNPGLVMARITAFGQYGPYSHKPGFGTLVESMSGFATMTGQPDGPPTLPPFGLADSICAMAASNAIMMALYHRAVGGGRGQQIDMSLLEPITTALGPHVVTYDQTGQIPPRMGNRSANNAPRNLYRTADGRWVAVSTSSTSIARRVVALVGHPEVTDEPWFDSGTERAARADLLDAWVEAWIAARPAAEVTAVFEAADAAVGPVYTAADLVEDPQVQALDMITAVDDEDLGPIRMQNVMGRFSDTPGRIRWTGRALGADTDQVLAELGIPATQVAELREVGVVV